jgi:surface antigen/putative component of membrane protein insertase Oxa1/YidC/SpoIIIJ protein YidD
MWFFSTPLALLAISGYQRFVSPHKGWHCAHAMLHGGPSCSAYARDVIAKHGVVRAVLLLRDRFRECREAASAIQSASPEEARDEACNQACDCGRIQDAFRKSFEKSLERDKSAESVPLTKECPSCGGTANRQTEDETHRWWKCSKCGRSFAEYLPKPHRKNVFTAEYSGFCTWYVADRWLHAGNPDLPSRKNAALWLQQENAKIKYQVDPKTPVKGAIVVFGPAGSNKAGHVAYVEEVMNDTYKIYQMNYGTARPGFGDRNSENYLKTVNFGLVTYDTLGINQTHYGKGEYKMEILGFIYPGVRP